MSVLLYDLSGSRRQIRTAIWTLSTFLSKVYDQKTAGNNMTFDVLWKEVKDDLETLLPSINNCKLSRDAQR